jgi:hypothetical protein
MFLISLSQAVRFRNWVNSPSRALSDRTGFQRAASRMIRMSSTPFQPSVRSTFPSNTHSVACRTFAQSSGFR